MSTPNSRKSFDIETSRAIGARIRQARGDRTQEEFAALVGVSRAALTNYEAGRRLPNDLVLKRIAEETGVDIPNLLFGRTTIPFEDYVAAIEDGAIREAQKRPGYIPRFMISDDEIAFVSLFRLYMDMKRPNGIKVIESVLAFWEQALARAKNLEDEPPIQWGEGYVERLRSALAANTWEVGYDPLSYLWPTLSEEAESRRTNTTPKS